MSSICNAEEEGQASSIYIMRQSRGESPFNVYNKVRWTATTFPRRTHLRAPSSPSKIPGRRRRRRLSRNRVGRPKKGRWGSSSGLGVPWPCNRSLDRTRPSLPKLCLNCTKRSRPLDQDGRHPAESFQQVGDSLGSGTRVPNAAEKGREMGSEL